MNYRITVYDGKNEIDRYYEESFFEDNELVGEAVNDMVKTLKTPYPKEWDKECRGRGIPDLQHAYPEGFISEREQEMRGDMEDLEKDNYFNK